MFARHRGSSVVSKICGKFFVFFVLGGLVLIFFERVPGLRGKEDKDGELGICLRKVLIC